MTGAEGPDGLTWPGHEKRPGVSSIGSLVIGLDGSGPVDENGFPYQVLIEYDEHDQALDLVRDEARRPLTWIVTPDGTDHVRAPDGRAALRPAPPEVAGSAEEWLAEERGRATGRLSASPLAPQRRGISRSRAGERARPGMSRTRHARVDRYLGRSESPDRLLVSGLCFDAGQCSGVP